MRDENIWYQLRQLRNKLFYRHLSFFTCKRRDECSAPL
jgi:hypothetical protein